MLDYNSELYKQVKEQFSISDFKYKVVLENLFNEKLNYIKQMVEQLSNLDF